MSWQAYVENLQAQKIKQAALIGHNGSAWASSTGLNLSAAEGAKIVKAFGNPSDIIANGIVIGGQKYFALRYDDRSLYGKKGTGGIVAVKTKQAVLIGVYDESIQPGAANIAVEKLADYLISINY